MIHLASTAVIDNDLAIVLAILSPYLGKERGEAVIIVHGPAIEGMIVTLRTLGANAHEDLSHILRRLQGVALNLIEVGGRSLECPAAGGDHLPHDFVDWRLSGQLVGQPARVLVGRLVTHTVVTLDQQQLGPLHRPDFTELLAIEESIDQCLAFVRRGICHKVAILVFGGEQADNVDCRGDAGILRHYTAGLGIIRSRLSLSPTS